MRLLFCCLCLLFSSQSLAMNAGRYYYIIADQCEARGPTDPEALDKVTPDVLLFDVIPAGISDYYVNMNTDALSDYTQDGVDYLSSLESEQAYTVGRDTNGVYHNFMLQREAIDRTTLVDLLASFSQRQSDKGYFYRKLLTLDPTFSRFKAVSSVKLVENTQLPSALLLTEYTTKYYLFDNTGNAQQEPYIEINHLASIKRGLHQPRDPFYPLMANGLCGEEWKPVQD